VIATKQLFVVGSPRSGTTLLAGALNQVAGVWIGKETGFIPFLYDATSEPVDEWDDRRLGTLIAAVNSYLSNEYWERRVSAEGVRRFWSETGTTGYAGLVRYVWSLDNPPDGADITFAGDQTPTYVLAIPLLEQLFPDAYYVHVVRDPRDVVASILPLRFGAHSAGVAAADWNECVAGWWAAERRLPPERLCEVRYEDLVAAPAETLRILAAFLGVAPPEVAEAPSIPLDVHGLAQRVAHHARLAEPIDDRSVGRHRRDLSDRDRALVEAITFNGMVSYGYDAGPFRPSPVLQEKALLLTRERVRDLRRRAVASLLRRWQR